MSRDEWNYGTEAGSSYSSNTGGATPSWTGMPGSATPSYTIPGTPGWATPAPYFLPLCSPHVFLRTPQRDADSYDLAADLVMFSEQNMQKGAPALMTGAWGLDPCSMHEDRSTALTPWIWGIDSGLVHEDQGRHAQELEAEAEAEAGPAQAHLPEPMNEALRMENKPQNKAILSKWWDFCNREKVRPLSI